MGLNSWGEELWLLYSKLLVWGMHGVTNRASLNWLFGVSCTGLVLSSSVGGDSDRICGEVIASRFSNLDTVFTEIRIFPCHQA